MPKPDIETTRQATDAVEHLQTRLPDLIGYKFQQYTAKELIDNGGMCAVYLGESDQPNSMSAAIKVYYQEHTHRAQREAYIGNQVPIDGIPKVLGRNYKNEPYTYIIMEYLGRVTLAKRLHLSNGMLPYPEALWLGRELSGILSKFHRRGFAHLDIKPNNIMLQAAQEPSHQPRVTIIDFGLAQELPSSLEVRRNRPPSGRILTQSAGQARTPVYAAPERQDDKSEPDGRSDVYSLGIVLYEILTGHFPFSGSDDTIIAMQHKFVPPRPVKVINSVISEDISEMLMQMLHKDIKNRPDMEEVSAFFKNKFDKISDEEACPFPGLKPYASEDAPYYYGREKDIDLAIAALKHSKSRQMYWLIVEGPNGVGKSSLVCSGLPVALAGLHHRCRNVDHSSVVALWCPNFQPKRHFIELLHTTLAHPRYSVSEIENRLMGSADGLSVLLREWKELTHHTRLTLIIDQFERLLHEDALTKSFLDLQLTAAVSGEDAPMALVTSVRSEDLGLLPSMPYLFSRRAGATWLSVNPPRNYRETVSAALKVINSEYYLEDAFAQKIQEAEYRKTEPYLINYTVLNLWKRRKGNCIGIDSSRSNDRISDSLSLDVEKRITRLTSQERNRLRALLLILAQHERDDSSAVWEIPWDTAVRIVGSDASGRNLLQTIALEDEFGGPPLIQIETNPIIPGKQTVRRSYNFIFTDSPTLQKWICEDRSLMERLNSIMAIHAALYEAQPVQRLAMLMEYLRCSDLTSEQQELFNLLLEEPERQVIESVLSDLQAELSAPARKLQDVEQRIEKAEAELQRREQEWASVERAASERQAALQGELREAQKQTQSSPAPVRQVQLTPTSSHRSDPAIRKDMLPWQGIRSILFAAGLIALAAGGGIVVGILKERSSPAPEKSNAKAEPLLGKPTAAVTPTQSLARPAAPSSPTSAATPVQPQPVNYNIVYQHRGGDMVLVSGTWPLHQTAMFLIDRTEVTVKLFQECVLHGSCKVDITPTTVNATLYQNCNWNKEGPKLNRMTHPMNCLTAIEAEKYCDWAEKRLPLDWEFEMAAFGGESARRSYSWGNSGPSTQLCWNQKIPGTCPVLDYPKDRSYYGAIGLAGNVAEWSASSHPTGGFRKCLGGHWSQATIGQLKGQQQIGLSPYKDRQNTVGFRCAKGVSSLNDLNLLSQRVEMPTP